MTAEEKRLAEDRSRLAYWKQWGPYLSERQWGTVREDYSADGSAWSYFPHDHSRSRAYRWGEDGIGGISDNHQRLCLAIALWNEQDPILKERIFGLSGPQGNHGEDVKEYYFYLDNTPSHAYMKYLYKYPQSAFPYEELVQVNRDRGYKDPEFELMDTGIFNNSEYFDVFLEYAKHTDKDIALQIKIINRADTTKPIHLLPTLWYRNTWSWFEDGVKPKIEQVADNIAQARHPTLGDYWFYCHNPQSLLFTDNETNQERIFQNPNPTPYVKDSFHDYLIHSKTEAVNPDKHGTKLAAYYYAEIPPGEEQIFWVRLSNISPSKIGEPFGQEFTSLFKQRLQEADEFYQRITPGKLSPDDRLVQRQAFAGLLWTKQFYHYVVEDWLKGDPTQPKPQRTKPRNTEWKHLFNDDIISMPDKWEFPWYASWDLAFHVVPLALIDPDFAKRQMSRLTREWYLHPNGQMPAYEWHFSDVNPPVHAWGTWRVYQIEKEIYGKADLQFLERVFQKLLLNFTWWVNQKDNDGNNVFQGGFLGLDNIGIFDRSSEIPTGGYLEQSDATSWMGMYCLNMLAIALELAQSNPVYEDIASKFFEHFLYIADAMNHRGDADFHLWDELDQFFYDVLYTPDGKRHPLRVRSMVGLIPLFATLVVDNSVFQRFPDFKQRFDWFVENRPNLQENIASLIMTGVDDRRLLAIANPDKLRSLLQKMLNEAEFLSDYGIRSLSRCHANHPYTFTVDGTTHEVTYEPAESSNGMFGGNSNWRGPVWFPVNYLLIESLQSFHQFLGNDFTIEYPTGSKQQCNLQKVADSISERLCKIFEQDQQGNRPVLREHRLFQTDPHWQNLLLFNEYFHGDSGAGLGANHQTGWTGLVATLIHYKAIASDAHQSNYAGEI